MRSHLTFRALPPSPRVLDTGPGLGRSLAFFPKALGWQDAELHAWEGEGAETKYTMLGPRFTNSFCGNFEQLKAILAFNGITDLTIHDAAKTPLSALPGPFDFVYSFYSVGFHWALEHFIDDILPLLGENGVAAFLLADGFSVPPQFATRRYEIVPGQDVYSPGKTNSILAILPGSVPTSAAGVSTA